MCGFPLWYFYSKETPVPKDLETILRLVDRLSLDKQKELLRILQLLLAVPEPTEKL